jgi:uncharacterized protein YecA (UPF0149 family)
VADPGDGFLASVEAAELRASVPERDLEEVLDRFAACAREAGVERAEDLDGASLHAIVGHDLPERFERRDPLSAHVGPALRAYLAYLARSGRLARAAEVEDALEATLPEFEHAVRTGAPAHHHPAPQPFVRAAPRVGRNDPCPCGSGRKFKRCCGTP